MFTDITSCPLGGFVTVFSETPPSFTGEVVAEGQHCPTLFFKTYKVTDGSVVPVSNGQVHEFTPGPIDLSSVNAGDVVYLRAGVYDVPSGNYGAILPVKSGVALLPYPGEEVVIDCSGGNGFDMGDKDTNDVTIGAFTFKNGLVGRAQRRGTRTNLRVVGTKSDGVVSGTSNSMWCEFSNTVGLRVLGNVITNYVNPGDSGHCIYHGGRSLNQDVEIAYNYLDNNQGRRGIQIYGHMAGESMVDLFIHHNHITRHGSSGTGHGILVSHTDGQSGDPCTRHWIQNCRIEDNYVVGSAGNDIRLMEGQCAFTIKNNTANKFTEACPANIVEMSGNSWQTGPVPEPTPDPIPVPDPTPVPDPAPVPDPTPVPVLKRTVTVEVYDDGSSVVNIEDF